METQFLNTLARYDWKDVPSKSKRDVFHIFASRGLVKEYVDLCYGEIDLLTALKLIPPNQNK